MRKRKTEMKWTATYAIVAVIVSVCVALLVVYFVTRGKVERRMDLDVKVNRIDAAKEETPFIQTTTVYPGASIYPLNLPVWTFGGSGKDPSYDSGGMLVFQEPQPNDPTATSPRDNPVRDWQTNWTPPYGTIASDTVDVTPSPSVLPTSGGAPIPAISTGELTGSNSDVPLNDRHCQFRADSDYACPGGYDPVEPC